MKLDRNETDDGRGKYALINMRKVEERDFNLDPTGKFYLVPTEAIEWGETFVDDFFVIKLKDKYARVALCAYAGAAMEDDAEYAQDITELARGAGERHPLCKKPD